MGWLLIIIAIVLTLFNKKEPSKVLDPKGSKKHDDMRAVTGGLFMIGLTIIFIQGC